MKKIKKIQLGSQVPIGKPHTNSYQLDVDFMHGDADGESDIVLMFSEYDEVKLLKVLNFYLECLYVYENNLEDVEISDIEGYDLVSDMEGIEMDRFYTDLEAPVIAVTLTYWSDEGIQYFTNLS